MQKLGLYPVKSPDIPIRERMRMIAEVGFDYVAASSVAQLTEPGPDGFLAACERHGLPIDNVHLTGKGTNKVWFPGPEGDEIIDRYAREMEQALAVGVDVGVVHVTWGFRTPPLCELGLARFARLVAHAEKIGFIIAFENSVSLPHYEAVLERYVSPNVHFCFDSGHWNEFCPDADIYRRWGHLMRVTHFDDNDGRRDLHVIPFDGCADFARLAPFLGHQERLTFEVSGVVCKQVETPPAETEAGLRPLAIAGTSLVRVGEGEFGLYESLGYEAYLRRLMAAGMRLRNLIRMAEKNAN